VSKFVEKSRKDSDYNDDYAFKPNRYERKKQDKQKNLSKRYKHYDVYDSDYADSYSERPNKRR
jgi:hypothetical protein